MFNLAKFSLLVIFLFIQDAYADKTKCNLTLAGNSVKVGWTAYKTTDKVAVAGEFSKISVAGIITTKASETSLAGFQTASSLEDLLKSLTVTIDKLSVQTQNPERDKTLTEFFFAKLKGGISGKITAVYPHEKIFTLMLNLNGMEKPVTMQYNSADNKAFQATGVMDLVQFNSAEQLSSLNNKCVDLHKGPDGVSKTWAEVQINITGMVDTVCLGTPPR